MRSIRRINLVEDTALLDFHSKVALNIDSGGRLEVIRGIVRIGYPLPKTLHFPTFDHTVVRVGKNASLIFDGDAFIAPRCTIKVGDNASLTIGDSVIIAHNTMILCNRFSKIGRYTSISWGVTLIDDDGHTFFRPDGTEVRRIRKSLSKGDNVGIQKGTLIPSGVTVGSNSIIAASTVVRSDVPSGSLVYTDHQVKRKDGYTTGFGRSEIHGI